MMAPYDEAVPLVKNDFITVFYGVGGVGKTTLCKKAMETASKAKSTVVVAMLNLDSDDWSPTRSFAGFLAGLVNQLSQGGISSPLTQVLLLMHSQVDAREHIAKSSSELWAGAIGLLDQATQAIGISGVGLLVQGVQWLKDRKQQADVCRRLRELGLWPDETEGGRINLPDLEEKLAQAFYEDLRQSAAQGKSLRILLDGFERIQARERRKDCQQLLQKWAGYLAADEDESLIGRIRLLIFGRDKLKWDELYDDPSWLEYITQHLLEGLGEADARDFIAKYAEWLKDHNQVKAADAVLEHTNAILDAADEGGGEDRRIYPYYLDLAVYMVHDGAKQNKIPDLGRAPGELQERFFRYLKSEELHLLKILALAEKFDADLFDALVRESRVAGFAVGTFVSAVANDRSYVTEIAPGMYQFHRLMAKALQDQWLKSDVERQQGGEAVRWLLRTIEKYLSDKPRKDWIEKEIELWCRGMDILVTQGYERELMSLTQCRDWIDKEIWTPEFPISLEIAEGFARKIYNQLESRLGVEHDDTLSAVVKLGEILEKRDNLDEAEIFYRRSLEVYQKVYGYEHRTTLESINKIATVYCWKSEYFAAKDLLLDSVKKMELILRADDQLTISGKTLLALCCDQIGDYKSSENYHREVFEANQRIYGRIHSETIHSGGRLADSLRKSYNINLNQDDAKIEEVERLEQRIVKDLVKIMNSLDAGELFHAIVSNIDTICNAANDEQSENIVGTLLSLVNSSERALGKKHPKTYDVKFLMADIYERMGHREKAALVYNEILSDEEKTISGNHLIELTAAAELAILLGENEDYAFSIELHQKYLQKFKEAYGESHPRTLLFLKNMGVSYLVMGDKLKALESFKNVLHYAEKKYSPAHSFVLSTIEDIGFTYRDEKKFDDEIFLYENALKKFGKHELRHSTVSHLFHLLADAYEVKGDHTQAKSFYLRALAGRYKKNGFEHRDTLETYRCLVDLARHNDPKLLEKLYYWRLRKVGKIYGFESPELLDAIKEYKESKSKLENFFEGNKDYKSLVKLYKKLTKISALISDDSCHNTYYYYDDLAYALQKNNELAEAEEIRRKLLDHHKSQVVNNNVPGPISNMISSIQWLGYVLTLRGKYIEAENLYREELSHLENKFGSKDLAPIQIKESLSKLLIAHGKIEEGKAMKIELEEIGKQIEQDFYDSLNK